MRLYFIRHGQTAGNAQGRYVGATDEPLCDQGVRQLGKAAYPAVDLVWVSPMKRCLETAELIAPGARLLTVNDFRECDFGEFEYKNYAELNGQADYQAWIDSGGTLPFPGGESREEFSARCAGAFEALMEKADFSRDAALVVHGGTIMAILEKFGWPRRDYYDYQLPCGGLIRAEVSPGDWAARRLKVDL